MKPDDLGQPELVEALEYARAYLEEMDAEGELENVDRAATAADVVSDYFIAWVGRMDGHPYYLDAE